MAESKIVVVGSCMLDIFIRAPRIPVVGETVIGSSVQTFVGGKGNNQAVTAARLGAAVELIGKVGADEFGERIISFSESAGVGCSGVVRDPEVATGVAVPVVFDDGGNSIVAVPQANMALTPDEVTARAPVIASADLLLVQFEVPMEATTRAVSIAKTAGVPIVLNIAPYSTPPDDLLPLVSVLIANETEAEALCGREGRVSGQAHLIRQLGPLATVITLGESGLVAEDESGPFSQDAFSVGAVDSVGAGDAFCGALGVALAEGLGLQEGATFAQAAAAISVTRPGAAASFPDRGEVDRFLSDLAAPG
ncbi:MAG TPA: ribokinase [Dehalococcoidia bacterium]|nr:ribokinase [Dehalococcoidia bacterium]